MTHAQGKEMAFMTPSGLSSLWKTEDWWAVWIGFAVILLSILLVWPYLPDEASAKVSVPASNWITRPKTWSASPLHAFVKTASEIEAESAAAPDPAKAAAKPYNVIPGLLFMLVILSLLFGVALAAMGERIAAYLLAFPAVFILAVAGYWLAGQASVHDLGLEYVLWALMIGLLVSNTLLTPEWMKPAVRTELYIKTGLVLLGAEILFGKIIVLGFPGVVVAWGVTPIVLLSMFVFGVRYLRLPPTLTLAVGISLLFTVVMMVAMPAFIRWVGIGEIVGGAWMGGTIDSTGAVVAAGALLGDDAEKTAAVVKMIQNILIGVIAFFVAVYWVTRVDRTPGAPRPHTMEIWYRFPKFILGFVAASILFSFLYQQLGADRARQALDDGVLKLTSTFRGWFFCLAFVSIGLESNFKELYRQMEGGKPLVLYITGQTFNLVLTLAVAYFMFRGFVLS